MQILEVKNVTKSYGHKENKTNVLKGVSFSVQEHSFVTILGTSGSGKSTLLKCIAGIEDIDAGEIMVAGTPIQSLSVEKRKLFRRQYIGMVFQQYDLLPILNVRENILLPLRLNKKKVEEAYLQKIVSLLGIEDKMKEHISCLSGGQQQRVAIARALITKPKLICADEPTGNLDEKNTEEVVQLFRSMKQELGATIFMITHDVTIAKQADQVLELSDGKIGEKVCS